MTCLKVECRTSSWLDYKPITSVRVANEKIQVFARLAALEAPVGEMFVTPEFYRVPIQRH